MHRDGVDGEGDFVVIFPRQWGPQLLACSIMNEVPQKKGMSALGWVGIGCGTVLLIGVVVVALLIGWCNRKVEQVQQNPERFMAELAINAHPDYSVVSSNDQAKEMTIKEDKTGKEMTFSYKDIADGEFAMTTSDGQNFEVGTVKLEDLPEFVKVVDGGVITSGYQATENGVLKGSLIYTTTETAEDVITFYEKSVETWSSNTKQKNNFALGGIAQHSIKVSDANRMIHVIAQKQDAQTTVSVTFEQK